MSKYDLFCLLALWGGLGCIGAYITPTSKTARGAIIETVLLGPVFWFFILFMMTYLMFERASDRKAEKDRED